jgi:hypothetical protein
VKFIATTRLTGIGTTAHRAPVRRLIGSHRLWRIAAPHAFKAVEADAIPVDT